MKILDLLWVWSSRKFIFLHSWNFYFLKGYVLQSSWLFSQEKKKKSVEQGEGCLKFGNHSWYLNHEKALRSLVLGDMYSCTKAVKQNFNMFITNRKPSLWWGCCRECYKSWVPWGLLIPFWNSQNGRRWEEIGRDWNRKVFTLHLDKMSYFESIEFRIYIISNN